MTLMTACGIVEHELETLDNSKYDMIDFHFHGGEPLINFKLIHDLCEWVWSKSWNQSFHFYVITNGTLLNTTMQKWFEFNKDKITVDISVDGINSVQKANRGCTVHELPIEWVHQCWPNSRFKMTISKKSLHEFANGVIGLVCKGYDVSSTLAIGEKWSEADILEYYKQWDKLINHYLYNGPIWKQLLKSIDPLFNESPIQDKCCNSGDNAITYDINGERYPCVIFTPLVAGKDMRKEFVKIDFSNPSMFADPECSDCFIRNMCKTCYGFNLLQRGNIATRDKTACSMIRIEINAICLFQGLLLRNTAIKRELTEIEIQRLNRANTAFMATKLQNYHYSNGIEDLLL